MDECIFKTAFANVLIRGENKSVIELCFTKKQVKVSSCSFLMDAKKQVTEYLKGKRKKLLFKIDPKGTLYQKKVWQELQKIPYGKSVYYSSIANKIQSSPRAIGNACGANKCLIIIPCHRVMSKSIKNPISSSFGGLVHKNILMSHENKYL